MRAVLIVVAAFCLVAASAQMGKTFKIRNIVRMHGKLAYCWMSYVVVTAMRLLSTKDIVKSSFMCTVIFSAHFLEPFRIFLDATSPGI